MDIFVIEPFTIKQSPTHFLPSLGKKQDGAYSIFLPFCPTRKTPPYRELIQHEGRGAICMPLCEGCALSWGSLESALPFKLRACVHLHLLHRSLVLHLILKKSC